MVKVYGPVYIGLQHFSFKSLWLLVPKNPDVAVVVFQL